MGYIRWDAINERIIEVCEHGIYGCTVCGWAGKDPDQHLEEWHGER